MGAGPPEPLAELVSAIWDLRDHANDFSQYWSGIHPEAVFQAMGEVLESAAETDGLVWHEVPRLVVAKLLDVDSLPPAPWHG